ncbi:MAG TPA: BamA/TamA family outer membrane protein [Polyangiaceae bacterium]
MKRPSHAVALFAAVACLLFGSARADEKRDVPDYDGRGEPPTTTGDVLLWGPRVLLAPPYLVSEYLLRRPFGFVIAGAERSGLPIMVYDFFTFGPDNKAGIFPTAFLQFGFAPSVGLYAFWDDAFVDGHDLRLKGETWGPKWLSGSLSERVRLERDGSSRFVLEAAGVRRPDYAFFGIGPDSRQSKLARYGMRTLELRTFVEKRPYRASSFTARVAVRDVAFDRGGYAGNPTLDDAIADGTFPAPPGYDRGYSLVESSISAAFDNRRARPLPGSGVRLQLDAAHSAELRRTESFVSYGGTLAGYLDVGERQRVLSLSLTTRFVDPIGDSEVPFTELVSLGGDQPMRGHYPERLTDRSAAVAGVSYRWPVWIFLDGAMNFEVGNVFGKHLEELDAGKLRWSGSIGVESNGSRDQAFQLLIGVGSETFESGGKVNSFRLALGTTHGF